MTTPTKPRPALATPTVDEFVEVVVAAAPPLPPETRATLRDLLATSADQQAQPADDCGRAAA